MDYVHLIAESLDYIEAHLDEALSLEQLSRHCFLSKFYFTRIFKAVTLRNPQAYIAERRLVVAAQMLRQSRSKIIDIALMTGFRSPEVFSRRFRQRFGISPRKFRHSSAPVDLSARLQPVVRDFKNYRQNIAARFEIREWEEKRIFYQFCHLNPENPAGLVNAHHQVTRFVERFLTPWAIAPLYTIVQSEEREMESVRFCFGYDANSALRLPGLDEFVIPASRVAVFNYAGELGEIFHIVFEDIVRALIVEKMKIKKTGFDFFQIYDRDYLLKGYQLCVPNC